MTNSPKRRHISPRRIACLAAVLMLLIAAIAVPKDCHDDDTEELEATVDSFATHFFNWQFQQALPYCTPDSRKWMRYMASQVSQADVDTLRNLPEGASVKIEDIDRQDDSTAVASITVKNFLPMDTLGTVAAPCPEARFQLPLTRNGKGWKVVFTTLRPKRTPRRA